jgi:hypothetical protein
MEPRKKQDIKKDDGPPQKDSEKQDVARAYEQAEEDIQQDPDLSIHSPNDDLDEAESARLGEDRTDLV